MRLLLSFLLLSFVLAGQSDPKLSDSSGSVTLGMSHIPSRVSDGPPIDSVRYLVAYKIKEWGSTAICAAVLPAPEACVSNIIETIHWRPFKDLQAALTFINNQVTEEFRAEAALFKVGTKLPLKTITKVVRIPQPDITEKTTTVEVQKDPGTLRNK